MNNMRRIRAVPPQGEKGEAAAAVSAAAAVAVAAVTAAAAAAVAAAVAAKVPFIANRHQLDFIPSLIIRFRSRYHVATIDE